MPSFISSVPKCETSTRSKRCGAWSRRRCRTPRPSSRNTAALLSHKTAVKIIIAAVGRLRDAPSRALFDDYAMRLSWPVAVREVELKRALSGPQAKAEEGRLLLEAIGDRATV